MERICLLQPHIETETEGTKTLLFINIRLYNERSDGSYILKNKTDFLTILSLMLSCYFQEKQRSFTYGDFWVLPRWQVTHFQFLSVFQDGGHVKFPTLGKARSVNFPWVARPLPPPCGLTLIGALAEQSENIPLQKHTLLKGYAFVDETGYVFVLY